MFKPRSAFDEEMLRDKARLICDQFLSSPILPKCRVNVTAEMAANVIEKVKLGMIDQARVRISRCLKLDGHN